MKNAHWNTPLLALLVFSLALVGCDSELTGPLPSADAAADGHAVALRGPGAQDGPYGDAFSPVAYDLEAAPDGSILVTQNSTIREIRNGQVQDVTGVPSIPGSPANGLAITGRRSFFATSGGLDLAAGAGVWHVSGGTARLVGDIEAFETENDPDAFEGPQWKNPACEEDPAQGFTAGPQSNPYHLTALSGSTVFVADAAGNTLLSAKKNGDVDWVAVFTPPTDANGEYRFLKTAEDDPEIDCYVQPVPTSVDVGPGGDYFVGELTGAPATPGWSRIWRIKGEANNVTCPSGDCEVAVEGLTSIIDLEFGPDGSLYVVEYDANGWLAATTGSAAGGTIKRCDVATGECETVESGLPFPSAITFGKRGALWLLENNIIAPVVRRVDTES
ncbi:MAG: ScyD/ScyE family protein [Bacteroidetes bacterium]|jgi:hypothetical protein|nr:ScyD/ScyE family protein [Bacteroidota bacterium]